MQKTATLIFLFAMLALSQSDHCDRNCPHTKDHICGTDGNVYKNACELQIAMCRNSKVQFAYDGSCVMGLPHCDDDYGCLNFLKHPVCGTDGVTYRNDCYFDIAQCHDKSLKVAYRGTCGKCEACEEFGIEL